MTKKHHHFLCKWKLSDSHEYDYRTGGYGIKFGELQDRQHIWFSIHQSATFSVKIEDDDNTEDSSKSSLHLKGLNHFNTIITIDERLKPITQEFPNSKLVLSYDLERNEKEGTYIKWFLTSDDKRLLTSLVTESWKIENS